jgi:hypothetical protein
MVTPIFDIRQSARVNSARAPRTDDDCLRYRLDVVAASAVDVVQSAGGWLYDRMMAGWEVTVLLPDSFDTRPLRILGVRALDLESELAPEPASAAMGATSQSLAVSAEAFSSDARVRDRVFDALGRASTEVALWGDGWPPRIDRGMTRVQHVLSAAARVFKGYSLVAAGISCDAVDPTETMLCDPSACLPVDSELIRLG